MAFSVPRTLEARNRLAAGKLCSLQSHVGAIKNPERKRQSLWGTMLHLERNMRRVFDGRKNEVTSELAQVLAHSNAETAAAFLPKLAEFYGKQGMPEHFCRRITFLDDMRNELDSTRYLGGNPAMPARRSINGLDIVEHYIAGYEKVLEAIGPAGFHAFIAIHNLVQGPALGGLRYFQYDSVAAALKDVGLLGEGMTMKSAVCEDNLGGGKSVLMSTGGELTAKALHNMAHFINHLGGLYITAEDVGTREHHMVTLREKTDFVTGLPRDRFPHSSGNPSPVTALGTLAGIRAALQHRYGHQRLADFTYAIQGVGGVGGSIAQSLLDAGATVTLVDGRPEALKPFRNHARATILEDLNAIYDVDATVFVPAAMGQSLNGKTIPRFKFAIVAGCANNQLGDPATDMGLLQKRNIIYVPDFVINAGGIINVSYEFAPGGYDAEAAKQKTLRIYDSSLEVLQTAEREGITTRAAAYRVAERKLKAIDDTVLKF